MRLYRKAAEQGHAETQNDLGFCYKNGTGVEMDPAGAAEFYSMAADMGNSDAGIAPDRVNREMLFGRE